MTREEGRAGRVHTAPTIDSRARTRAAPSAQAPDRDVIKTLLIVPGVPIAAVILLIIIQMVFF